jgi:uncharacterized protein YdeI (YjbR/CyaY-like superfamily)
MEDYLGIKAVHAPSQKHWRTWLQKNHRKEQAVWLIIYRKTSATPSVYYPEAVDEALCFGWIDSKPNKRDHESYYLYFSPRKPKSKWSKVNKIKVEQLFKAGKIALAGQAAIDLAKKNGTWYALDKVENLEIPDDFKKKLSANKSASQFWDAFPPSAKKGILQWIESAKRDETRKKRIEETVKHAALNVRANQYTPK